MNKVKISKQDAARLVVHGQFQFEGNGDDLLPVVTGIIQHLGYVQIDSISVVERAHHHIIWSRLHNYQRGCLTKLQQSPRKVFEYWGHAASYLPIEDYRYCLPRIKTLQAKGFTWHPRVDKDADLALKMLEKEGPMQARNFQAPPGRKAGTWWDWKPMKIALEHLFHEGRVMVVTRKNFQKVYDLTERVLPNDVDTCSPTDKEMATYLINKSLRSLGVASEKDFSYGRKHGIKGISRALAEKIERGEVTTLEIEGLSRKYYSFTSLLEEVLNKEHHTGKSLASTGTPGYVRLLSPFDNQVIIRQRLKDIFNFQYQLECYVPQAKRKYGYFSLPILYNDTFVGILDAKAHRKEKILNVNTLYLSNVPEDMDNFLVHLAAEVNAYMQFNNCSSVKLDKLIPKGFKRRLKSLI